MKKLITLIALLVLIGCSPSLQDGTISSKKETASSKGTCTYKIRLNGATVSLTTAAWFKFCAPCSLYNVGDTVITMEE